MPRKNANARQPQGNSTTLRAVPDPAPGGRSGAEDKLWAALRAYPGATTTELAERAGIGRSTAGKILPGWERDGTATRTPGPAQGKRRSPDTWTTTDTDPPADPPTSEPTETDDTRIPGRTQPPPTSAATASASGAAERAAPDSAPVAPAPDSEHAAATARLGKGALRGLVEDYLAEHSDQQHSPSAIGRALARSSGAVANALDRLVADGYAVQSQDKPKRYQIKAGGPGSATG
ncbi:MAG: MarR family transcriptional regulator [Pseudonocardiaceae bacterium]